MKEQFLQRMKEYLQEDYEAYVKTLEEDAYRGLRVNTTKISVEAFYSCLFVSVSLLRSVLKPFIFRTRKKG